MKIDVLNDLNFASLEKQGITRQEGLRLLMVFFPEIKKNFDEQVMKVVGKEKLGQESEIEEIESIYFDKTGRYFMEEFRVQLNNKLEYLAKAIKIMKGQMDKYQHLSKVDKEKLQKLVDKNDWEEALKLINQDLVKKRKEGDD